jgi:signal transduction histidine kinase
MWWLDILVPLLLSAAILTGFLALIYSGQRHRRIASKIEERFIGISLRTAGAAPEVDTKWLKILSLQESDGREFAITREKGIRDISIADYSKILGRIVKSHPETIFVAWVPAAHNKMESYEPLNVVLRAAGDTKVVFAVRYDQISFIPEDTRKLLTIVDSDACSGAVQNICTFDLNWTDWMPQFLANKYMKNIGEADKLGFISENLPRSQRSYLIYLQDTSTFESSEFSSVTKPTMSPNFSGKTIFIGNGLYQDEKSGRDPRREVSRVLTHISPVVQDSRISGVSLHIFWAQLAQMFKSGRQIEVAPEYISWLFAGLVGGAILLVLLELGVASTLGIFLLFVVSAPYVNGGLIKYFNVYVPIFDIIFSGISSFFIATFGKLSINAYRRWSARMRKEQEENSRDLKGNFLSLISHNLNTPVAKMQGMLDILQLQSSAVAGAVVAKEAGHIVAQIQMCIRAVLTSNALMEGSLQNTAMTVMAIRDEFESQMRNCLVRLMVNPEISFGTTESDLLMLPLNFDRRVIVTTLASMCSLFRVTEGRKLVLQLEVQEGTHNDRTTEELVCRVSGSNVINCPSAATILANSEHLVDRGALEILAAVALKVIDGTAAAYNGAVKTYCLGDSTVIELTLLPGKISEDGI